LPTVLIDTLREEIATIVAATVKGACGFRGGGFHGGGFTGGFHGRGFHNGFGRRFAFGSGLGYGPYAYDGYYDDPYEYYDDGGCYVVQRRVHTKHGWRRQPVQVCG
jgi:hypothetical protein